MITSVQNNQVKSWKKLHQRKHREQTKTFIIEGYHSVEEAKKSEWEIECLIIREGTTVPDWTAEENSIIVSEQVFRHLAQTRTPQGIMAIVRMKQFTSLSGRHFLLIDQVQDPGNLGTIIRTADAAGYDGVVLGEGTVDLYNDKVIRATQGSLFHLPIINADLSEQIAQLKNDGFEILASSLQNAVNYTEIRKPEKLALILGNEGAGVSQELIQAADQCIKIPIYGQAESLNVSIAAGILMYALKV